MNRYWALIGVLAAVWGASYLFIKVAVEGGLEPAVVAFARVLVAIAVLVPLVLARGGLGPLRGHQRRSSCSAP